MEYYYDKYSRRPPQWLFSCAGGGDEAAAEEFQISVDLSERSQICPTKQNQLLKLKSVQLVIWSEEIVWALLFQFFEGSGRRLTIQQYNKISNPTQGNPENRQSARSFDQMRMT